MEPVKPAEFGRMLQEFIASLPRIGLKALNNSSLSACIALAEDVENRALRLQDLAATFPAESSKDRDAVHAVRFLLAKVIAAVRESIPADWQMALHPDESLQRVRHTLNVLEFLEGDDERRTVASEMKDFAEWMLLWLPPQPNGTTEAKPDDNEAAPIKAAPILNNTLLGILKALDGKSMRVEELARVVTGGETTRLYRDGMKTVLEKEGFIILDRKIGWYRPDKPPADRIPPISKLGAKK